MPYTKYSHYINNIFITAIKLIRPLLGPATCLFDVSCTNYAIFCLEQESFLKALYLITKRLLLCNPIMPLLRKFRLFFLDKVYKI